MFLSQCVACVRFWVYIICFLGLSVWNVQCLHEHKSHTVCSRSISVTYNDLEVCVFLSTGRPEKISKT